MTAREPDSGVALVNVLLVMAISATMVQTMLAAQERAITTAQDAADRTQAFALGKGGVAAMRAALRRDLVTGPEADHLGEPWAALAQEPVSFDFGNYAVTLEDPQGRFDLNSLTAGAIAQQRVFAALLAALSLPDEVGQRIAEILSREAPLRSVAALGAFGIDELVLEKLSPYVAALPAPASINLNTAPEPVLQAVFGNAIVARALVERRAVTGFLTRRDLADLGVLQPVLTGWRSDIYDVLVAAKVGDMTVQYARRILRDPNTGTVTDVPGMWPQTQ